METVLTLVLAIPVEVKRFPSQEKAAWMIGRLDHLRGELETELENEPIDPEFWVEWLEVVKGRQGTWSALLNSWEHPHWRQQHLADLKERLGAEAFKEGKMPGLPHATRLYAPWRR